MRGIKICCVHVYSNLLMQNVTIMVENGEGRSQEEDGIGDAIEPRGSPSATIDTDRLTGKAVAPSSSQRDPAPHSQRARGCLQWMLVLGRSLTSAPSSLNREEEEDRLVCPSPGACSACWLSLACLGRKRNRFD